MSATGSTAGLSGDRVQVIAAIPDGTCADCLAGHQAICPNQLSMGYQFPGGFAEYMIVPREVLAVDGLTRIPDDLSYAEASLAEPLACVLNGQELARVGEGDTVVVIGSGPIGCLHVRLARARGAARVILIDLNADRLAAAAALVAPRSHRRHGHPGPRGGGARRDRRSRRRRRDHRRRIGRRAGAGPADAGAARHG